MAPKHFSSYFRIRELLDERGMTQTELSRRSGVSQARVNRLCSDRASGITLRVLDAIGNALGVPGKELIGDRRVRK